MRISDWSSDVCSSDLITRGYEALVQRPAGWKPRPGETEADQERRLYDEVAYIPWLRKLRQSFAVAIEPKMIAGVQTDIVTPREGISGKNADRVLINLHGGGTLVGGRYGGQQIGRAWCRERVSQYG